MTTGPALAPGMLLVATRAMTDPTFAQSVVLLLDVEDGGALGVVLNRPTQLPVGQVLGAWAPLVTPPAVLFSGGPVERDGAVAVGVSLADGPVEGLRPVVGRLVLVDLDGDVGDLAPALDELRVFAGYSGWGPGQLSGEVERGDWYVVPALPEDAFRTETAHLWRDVLRRQPGDLALHSTRPVDPEHN